MKREEDPQRPYIFARSAFASAITVRRRRFFPGRRGHDKIDRPNFATADHPAKAPSAGRGSYEDDSTSRSDRLGRGVLGGWPRTTGCQSGAAADDADAPTPGAGRAGYGRWDAYPLIVRHRRDGSADRSSPGRARGDTSPGRCITSARAARHGPAVDQGAARRQRTGADEVRAGARATPRRLRPRRAAYRRRLGQPHAAVFDVERHGGREQEADTNWYPSRFGRSNDADPAQWPSRSGGR